MTKLEFENRFGSHVSESEYKAIEKLYMEAGDMDKDQFCKEYKKHGESELVSILYQQSIDRKESLRALKAKVEAQNTKMAHFLIKKSMVGGDQEMIQMAIDLIGTRAYLEYKFNNRLNLLQSDKDLILNSIEK